MARRTAPLKSTSGTGFDFESYVGAFFLACLLAGDPPVGLDFGCITRIDFQVQVMGWYLDDMLLTFEKQQRLAISVKSNTQITSEGAPEDFARDVWEQFLHEGSQIFDATNDYLALATTPLAPEVNSDLQEILRWARDQDEARFLIQVQAKYASSATKRNLFSSLQCPQELVVKYGVKTPEIVHLLRRLRFLSFDFLNDPSQDIAASIRICRSILRSGDLAEARDLWQRLIEVASSYRQSGGYLDLARLLAELQGTFELKQWPQYEPDIAAIRQWTSQALDKIPDKIGLKVHIERTTEITKLSELLKAIMYPRNWTGV
jgi:hypothetical protein